MRFVLGLYFYSVVRHFLTASPAWVVITDNEHYLKLAGVAQLVRTPEHKQEIVAGNIAEVVKAGK